VPDVTRFAGYPSPSTLVRDPLLSREDKVGALRSWRGLVLRAGLVVTDDPTDRERLMREIGRALERVIAG
jgi:hypothetical protein